MPIINFTMFADKVASGEKRQTIRAIRKRPIKVGDKLYLYSGLRTKNVKSLFMPLFETNYYKPPFKTGGEYGKKYVICKEVHDIEITYDIIKDKRYIKIDDEKLDNTDFLFLENFARKDGFSNANEMFKWFDKTHGLPFKGQLIKW